MYGDAKTLFEQGMSRGETFVLVARNNPGVVVPEVFKSPFGSPNLVVLKFSHRYHAPLTWDDNGIKATLALAGKEYPVVIPWTAVAGVGGEGVQGPKPPPVAPPPPPQPLPTWGFTLAPSPGVN